MIRRPLVVLAVVLNSFTAACSESGSRWEPLPAGTTVLERSSPDLEASAVVIAQEEPGSYRLEIRDGRSSELLASRTMAAPVGYHAQLVTLDWSTDGKRVTATIDYDFGDGNMVFELSP